MLGISFADQLEKAHKKLFAHTREDVECTEFIPTTNEIETSFVISPWKLFGIEALILLLVFLLLARAITLQIVKGSYYAVLAEENRIIRRPILAPRGVLIDAKGTVLVRNSPFVLNKEEKKLDPYNDYINKTSTTSGTIKDPPAIFAVREYPYPQAAAHVLGYVSSITEEEITKNKKITSEEKVTYSAYDVVGRTGLEESYEELLKGRDGSELVEIDSKGKVQKIIGAELPKSGSTIKTSLDIGLQKLAYEKVAEATQKANAPSGVAIVQNPNNGAIMAIVNYPSFDNNSFTHSDKHVDVEKFLNDSKTPLLNRAIGGAFPPGSTYKIITSLAGLESGTITQSSVYQDTGNISISGITFNNWYFSQYGKMEGNVDIRKALQRSNDTFYYKLALAMGPEKIAQQSEKFRLGQLLGIDIPGETKGLIPTPEWKKKTQNEVWYPGNTINMSIGQGDVLTTPLQIVSMTSAIANGGIIYVPTLATEVQNQNGVPICTKDLKRNKWTGDTCKKLNQNAMAPVTLDLNQQNLKAVQEGMHLVTQKGGTAYPFFTFSIDTAGKTGTAETSSTQKPNAWFTGYAPYKNPEIAVTVLIEKGGEGSAIAAPVAKDIMEYYFKNR
jgi:penicillin-binding protein 2